MNPFILKSISELDSLLIRHCACENLNLIPRSSMLRSLIVSITMSLLSFGSAAETKILSSADYKGISVVEYQGHERFVAFGEPFLWDAEDTQKILCLVKGKAYDVSEAGANNLNHYPLKVKQIGGTLFVLTYASFTAIDIEECFSNGRIKNNEGKMVFNRKASKVLSIKAPSIVKYAEVTYTFCDFLDDERFIYLLDCTGKLTQFDKKTLKITAENTPIRPELEYIFSSGKREAGRSPTLLLTEDGDELIIYGRFATSGGITGNDVFREVRVDKFTLTHISTMQAFKPKTDNEEGCHFNHPLALIKREEGNIFIGAASESRIWVILEKSDNCFKLSNRTFFKDIHVNTVRAPSSAMISKNLVFFGNVYDVINEKIIDLELPDEVLQKCKISFTAMALKKNGNGLFLCRNAGWYEGDSFLIFSDAISEIR